MAHGSDMQQQVTHSYCISYKRHHLKLVVITYNFLMIFYLNNLTLKLIPGMGDFYFPTSPDKFWVHKVSYSIDTGKIFTLW